MRQTSTITTQRATVLLVDLDPERSAAVLNALGQTSLRCAASAGEAAGQVSRDPEVDLVVIIARTSADAARACEALQGDGADQVPVLAVLPALPLEARLAVLETGAEECLLEPLDVEVLRRRALALVHQRHRWGRAQEELRRLGRLSQLKDDLATLVVHDLRNPLAGIFGYLGTLEAAVLADSRHADLRRDVAAGLRSARKLHDALGELLEIRMLEDNALPLHCTSTSLAALAHSSVATLESTARDKAVLLRVDTSHGETAVIDGRLVQRALENLIANAVKYAPGGSTIAVSVRQHGRGVRITVTDDGPGVPDGLKAAVFDKFATVEGARGAERRGFGLGLYQVRLAVQAHGGSATVRDREGGGAIFELWFPRSEKVSA
jgi:signal transduction histidine kinase